VLVDVGRLPGLAGIDEHDGGLSIGALARHRQVETVALSAANALVTTIAAGIGHLPIRMRGTVGGSIAHADPAADLPVLALALDAHLVATSRRGTRTIPASEFFVMPFVTALEPDELLVEIRLPAPPPGEVRCAFRKHAHRQGDFAIVSALARLVLDPAGTITDVRLGLGGVAGTPVRPHAAERILIGTTGEPAALRAAVEAVAAAADPRGDVHASAAFRRHLTRVLGARALRSALGGRR
jgi:CO/xanthine dehydrogenase FAD-binding subunit